MLFINIYRYLFTSFRVFYTSVSLWILIGVGMTASFFKSPGLFSIFWPISGCSSPILLFSSPQILVPILWWLYQKHQWQLMLPSILCSTVFFDTLARSRNLCFFFAFFQVNSLVSRNHHYLVRSSGRDLVIRLYLKITEKYVRLILLDRIWVFAYTICSYGQISTSCTISSGSSCLPSRVYTYTLSVLVCRIPI